VASPLNGRVKALEVNACAAASEVRELAALQRNVPIDTNALAITGNGRL
jgi:hypothetical protein